MTTLLYHMRDKGIRYGLQTMCEGGGRPTRPSWSCCDRPARSRRCWPSAAATSWSSRSTGRRPATRSTAAVSIGVGDALEEAQHDPDVRAVVITGAGDKSFCAGADLKAISRRENLYHPDHAEWGFAGYVHHFIDKPTIAAVNGTALGGGTELALASDLVVADELAKFGLPEVKRGLIAAAGGVFRIMDQLPRKVAMELLLTGEPTHRLRRLGVGPGQPGRQGGLGAGCGAGPGRAGHR